MAQKGSLLPFLGVVTVLLLGYYALEQQAPPLGEEDGAVCRGLTLSRFLKDGLPRALGGTGDAAGNARRMYRCAAAYKAAHEPFALAVYAYTYMSLQMLAIPGTLVLSILAGMLWPLLQAQLLIAACATTGSALCFALSATVARPVAERILGSRLADMRARVAAHKGDLLYYMLFLRLTPLVPNWTINLTAPLAGVPMRIFVASTVLGLVPANYFHTQTGATLAELASEDAGGGFHWRPLLTLLGLQFVALAPTLFKRRLEVMDATAKSEASTNGGVQAQRKAGAAATPNNRSRSRSNGRRGRSASVGSNSSNSAQKTKKKAA